ncbi:3-oxoacyl-[acyl-carrier-protein] synthase, KASIII [Lachnospiraceae bacterium KM106-2]|nr:3-oxoacyl-[acyl-carrier-protein] synthase, KASIII [Lachnospiraceae bacterium KM106-2]
MRNVQIKDIAIYHPEKTEEVTTFIKHFEKQGKDTKDLLTKVCGRKNYYVIDNEGKLPDERENSITMKIKAAKMLFAKCQLSGEDIDALIVATQAPEHLVPPDSLVIHNELNLKSEAFAYDINSNCASMLTALEQGYYYMEMKPSLNRILIIGGDYLTYIPKHDQEMIYGCFGDSACAIILERTTDGSRLIDSDHYLNSDFAKKSFFPNCGMSNIMTDHNIQAESLPVNPEMPIVAKKIKAMLDRNHLSVSDIHSFCFSQYVHANIKLLEDALSIPDEKCPYVGDVYAYTGPTSPFLALSKAIESGTLKRGDYIYFWTIGNGTQHIFMLIKY